MALPHLNQAPLNSLVRVSKFSSLNIEIDPKTDMLGIQSINIFSLNLYTAGARFLPLLKTKVSNCWERLLLS